MKDEQSLDLENLDSDLAQVVEIVADYIKTITSEPVVSQIGYQELRRLIPHDTPRQGLGVAKVVEEIKRTILPHCTRIGHPRFLAWIVTSPSPAGTLGEILNVGLNQVPLSYKGGPAATVLEEIVTKWIGELFGYDGNHGGILVSGGTMANLTALAVAREVHEPQAMKRGLQGLGKPLTVYVSQQSHISVERSAGMLGIGADFVKKIPTDSRYKMRADLLCKQVERDQKAGLNPFCVVAQAGSVNTGSIDPLGDLADICAENRMWFHVDAAYGGGVILTQNGPSLFHGIERADSIATDPHKWFFIPVEAGCTLVRNRTYLYETYKCKAGYLGEETSMDFMNYGFQLTRASRALKIWFAFRVYGLDRIARVIERNMETALQFQGYLAKDRFWELLAPVELSIVCFRYVPSPQWHDEALNSLQYEILADLEATGKAFLTPAVLNGRVALRICFANHRTTSEDGKLLLELLSQIGARVATRRGEAPS